MIAAVVAPVLHKYELPVDAVNVVDPPLQTVVTPLMLATLLAFTVTAVDADPVQPAALLTLTVYEVFAVGLTVMAAVVAPVLHKYELPVDAVNVVEPPLQIDVFPEMEGVGFALTVTEVLADDALHPFALKTVTL